MQILITYASNSGSTYFTAKSIYQLLIKTHPSTSIKRASETTTVDVSNSEIILVGSPSWFVDNQEGQPHETIKQLLSAISEHDVKGKKFAAFGCGDTSYLNFCNAVEIIRKRLIELGASEIHQPLKIDSFFYKEADSLKQANDWASILEQKLPVSSLL